MAGQKGGWEIAQDAGDLLGGPTAQSMRMSSAHQIRRLEGLCWHHDVTGRHNGFAPRDPVYVGYCYGHYEVK